MASLPTTRTILAVQIITLFAGSFCAVDVAGGRVVEAVHRGQREFDYFVLALQWPGTFCRRTRQCCSSNACCRGANTPSEFTIHGLWPDYNDGTWPACCTRSSFDVKEIATLRQALEKYWPSLSCEKHGTCSSPVVRDEYSYFLTTLNVYFKYNVTEVLKEAGYVPSNSEKYPLGGIISAVQNAFHMTPLLICSKGAVQELRLCFYKDFKPRDCVNATSSRTDMISSKSSCPSYVSLPAYTARKWRDSILMVTSQGIILRYQPGVRILFNILDESLKARNDMNEFDRTFMP
ncbi:hypothetical protein RJ639_035964 [Escallonia herrerae]|uniref:Uncharacterized protein n=1 Tax=Escallonia herrerae TaxID=1293975 RepID=A0AA88WQ31_9ASTE|nr:hypothetical protein RJ639_035964 [Escallonia herrerae]